MSDMKIVCNITDTSPKNVVMELWQGDFVIFSQKCEQNYFCEKISLMAKNIFLFANDKIGVSNLENVNFECNFDILKNITTYRIFNSFFSGMLLPRNNFFNQ